jgi:thiamine biosynthesis lipoprotein
MGSDAHVIVVGGSRSLLDAACSRIEQLEQRWSRFVPESEIGRLNQRAGQRVEVSADSVELVTRALQAWRATNGLFDPTVLGALVRAGYDRSFDLINPADAHDGASALELGAAGIAVGDGWVKLPADIGFDPGGVGKGLAADLVVDELLDAGAEGACVNLGGDIRAKGEGPDGHGWTIEVRDPREPAPLAVVGITDGAIASSSTLRRRWLADGVARHHLIDPATSEPSTSNIVFATAVAAHAWAAEVWAKVVIISGGFDVLNRTGVEALAVDDRGKVSRTFGFAAYAETAA